MGHNGIWLSHGWLGADEWFIKNGKTNLFNFYRDPGHVRELAAKLHRHQITDLFPRRRSKLVASALEIENLSVADPHSGERFLADINFSLRVGDVLGIGGLMGAGRTELLMHLFGAWGTRLS